MANEVLILTVPTAMAMGLAFGAGPCNVACLPYLGPVFVASDGGIHQSWRRVLPFSLGRLTGYGTLGLVAGLAGKTLNAYLESGLAHWLLGGAVFLVGLNLLLRGSSGKKRCASSGKTIQTVHMTDRAAKPGVVLPGGLFIMGSAMALNPCLPLNTVLLAAAATASGLAGLLLGVGFGLGAVIIPSLIFGIGIAHFGAELRTHLTQWRRALERTSAMVLVLMGIATVSGWLTP